MKRKILREGPMRTGPRGAAAIIIVGALLAAAGCGGGGASARGATSQLSGAPPEVLAPLKPLGTPYQIIYYPPVDLAKRPDTSKAARAAPKPRS